MRHPAFPPLLCLALLASIGCGGDDPSGPSVDDFLSGLPTWSSFAPPQLPPEEEGEQSDAEVLERFDVVETIQNEQGMDVEIVKECTTRQVDFASTPREYVMLSPPINLYPGALVEGRSIRDGGQASDIRPLRIDQRTPIDVTIEACMGLGEENSRRVQPTQAEVSQARSDIVTLALAAGDDCVDAKGSLTMESYRNDSHKALRLGFSGRYFGFSAEAEGEIEQSSTENAISVNFVESVYTMSFEPPALTGDFFSDAFTPEVLERLQAADRIGIDNLPVYVASVTYGRLMNFTMVSSASESEMRAAVSASYDTAVGGASIEAESEQGRLLQSAEYRVAYLGGNAEATSSLLQNLRWQDYFSVPVSADDAVPISYTLRNLTDNSLAVVQELTSYQLTECKQVLAADETFTFEPELELQPGFSAPGPVAVAVGDLNGDGRDDLVLAASGRDVRGELRYALAQADGTFGPLQSAVHPGVPASAGRFSLFVADVDGAEDGREEIVLVEIRDFEGVLAWVTGIAPSGPVHGPQQLIYDNGGWSPYSVRVAQMDGKAGVDLVFVSGTESTDINRTYIAYASGEAPSAGADLFTARGPFDHPARNFSGYDRTHIGFFDQDDKADIIWHNIRGGPNAYYVALGTETGLDFSPGFRNIGSEGWGRYDAIPGMVTDDALTDLILPRRFADADEFGIYVLRGDVTEPQFLELSSFQPVYDEGSAVQDRLKALFATPDRRPDMMTADVNGDGLDDLIINDKGFEEDTVNEIGVAIALENGRFSFARVNQIHPSLTEWEGFQTFFGDVDGDQDQDIIWVSPAANTRVFVGKARGN